MVQMSMPEAFRALNTCSQIAPPMPVKAMQAPMMVPEFLLNHLLHSVGTASHSRPTSPRPIIRPAT